MPETGSRWDDAEFTQTLAQISWMASTAVRRHLNERATGHPMADWITGWGAQFCEGADLRVLVLGCGDGWLERSIAPHGAVARIDAVDVAADAVARARAAAQGIEKIHYGVIDLNRDELERETYDVVIAHSILHHVENLEHAFAQIRRAMRPRATLLVNEYVGPNRFQFDPLVLDMMNAILTALPERLRRGCVEPGVYARREIPWVQTMIELDPTEAVRSDELMELLRREFNVVDEVRLGGTILQHLLYDIVQNFRFDDPRDRAMLELICTFEGTLVDHWLLPSDFALVAARVIGAPAPCDSSSKIRHAVDYTEEDEADPLGRGERTPRRGGGGHTRRLPEWALRMLRIALASNRPSRGRLIAERPRNRRIEQLRYVLARDASPFDWIVGRYAATADLASEEARAILALLETFEAIALERGLVS